MFTPQLLAHKHILITGGGTGLGRAMAERFLQLGAEVSICGRRKGVCDDTAKALMAAHGGKVNSWGGSLAVDPGSIGSLMVNAIRWSVARVE